MKRLGLAQKVAYALIALFPTQLTYHFWGISQVASGKRIDFLVPALYATDLLILGLFVLLRPWQKLSLKHNLGLLSVSALVALLHSSDSLVTQGFWMLKYLEIFYLVLAFTQLKLNPARLSIIFQIQILLIAILAFFQFLSAGSIGNLLYWLGERNLNLNTLGIAKTTWYNKEFIRPYATFSHPNTLSGYLLILALFTQIRFHVGMCRVCVLILPILILAKSQAVWFAIPILFLISHFPNYIRFWHLFLGHILTPLLLLKLTFLKEESLVVRNTIFTNSLALLGQNPLIGIGFFGNITNLEKLRTAQALKLLQPVHNLFWFALTSLGSFVVILGLFFSKIKLVLSTKASSSLPLSAIIITGAFDHYWFTQQQTLLLLAFIISQSSFFKASNK